MLGSLLTAAGYTSDGLRDRLGEDTEPAVLESRLTDASPLNTLIRLFYLGTPQSWQETAAALPGLDPDRLITSGVLEAVGDDVRASVRLIPHKDVLVAYEPVAEPPKGSSLLSNMDLALARHRGKSNGTTPRPNRL